MSISIGILVLWIGRIDRLVKAGKFFDKPKIKDLVEILCICKN